MTDNKELCESLNSYANAIFAEHELEPHVVKQMAIDMATAVAVIRKQDTLLYQVKDGIIKACAEMLKVVGTVLKDED